MDIKEYIVSGVLENYLLGLLTAQEQQEVERNAAMYPEIKAELEAIEEALNTYAQANAVPMREGLQDEILSVIDGLEKDKNTASTNEKSGVSNAWAIGLGILAIALGVLSFWLYQSFKNRDQQLQEKLQIAAEDCDRNLKTLEGQLNILRDPFLEVTKLRKIQISNSNTPNDAVAAVYNNPNNQTAYVDLLQLPNPPSGKQYQLWGIRIENGEMQPVSMGIIDPNDEEQVIFEMKYLDDIDQYAITLEDLGEQLAPDLSQLYVLGEV